uniref:Lysine-specific demethylase n=1 Tax=Petromyzon marinus TaxID=7757 RepID=S4RZ18_PETMA
QKEGDSPPPLLEGQPELLDEVKDWIKEQKVQEIFMHGPYSLNGYRVRVYRQDSATQWFTAIITHHDLFSRTMIVMTDQVLEPQNVDPALVQMTFLDDVVHSLLKGENVGITSRRRSCASQMTKACHGHFTRGQSGAPAPGAKPLQLRGTARNGRRKGSDSSTPDEDRKERDPERVNYYNRQEFHFKGINFHMKTNIVNSEKGKSKARQETSRKRKAHDGTEKDSSSGKRSKAFDSSDSEGSESEKSIDKVSVDGDAFETSLRERETGSSNTVSKEKEDDQSKSSERERPDATNFRGYSSKTDNTATTMQAGEFDVKFRTHQRVESATGNLNEEKSLPVQTADVKEGNRTDNIASSSRHITSRTGEVASPATLDVRQAKRHSQSPVISELKRTEKCRDYAKDYSTINRNSSILPAKGHIEQGNSGLLKSEHASKSMSSVQSHSKRSGRFSQEDVHHLGKGIDYSAARMDYLNVGKPRSSPQQSRVSPKTSRSDSETLKSSFQPVPPRSLLAENVKGMPIVDKKEQFMSAYSRDLDAEAKHLPFYSHPFVPSSSSSSAVHHALGLPTHAHLLSSSPSQAALAFSSSHLAPAHHLYPSGMASAVHAASSPMLPPHLNSQPTMLPSGLDYRTSSAALLSAGLDSRSAASTAMLAPSMHASSLTALALASAHLMPSAAAYASQMGLYPILWHQQPSMRLPMHPAASCHPSMAAWSHLESAGTAAENTSKRSTHSPWPLHHATTLPDQKAAAGADTGKLHKPLPVNASPRSGMSDNHRTESDRKHMAAMTPPKSEALPMQGLWLPHSHDPHSLAHRGHAENEGKQHHSSSGKQDSELARREKEMAMYAQAYRAKESELEYRKSTKRDMDQKHKTDGPSEKSPPGLAMFHPLMHHRVLPSGYFTSLSQSVVNEPIRHNGVKGSRAHTSSVMSPPLLQSLAGNSNSGSNSKALSRPPPLIKHQPELQEVNRDKMSDRLMPSSGHSVITGSRKQPLDALSSMSASPLPPPLLKPVPPPPLAQQQSCRMMDRGEAPACLSHVQANSERFEAPGLRAPSPLKVASPQQLQAAMMQPLELQRSRGILGENGPPSHQLSNGLKVYDSKNTSRIIVAAPASVIVHSKSASSTLLAARVEPSNPKQHGSIVHGTSHNMFIQSLSPPNVPLVTPSVISIPDKYSEKAVSSHAPDTSLNLSCSDLRTVTTVSNSAISKESTVVNMPTSLNTSWSSSVCPPSSKSPAFSTAQILPGKPAANLVSSCTTQTITISQSVVASVAPKAAPYQSKKQKALQSSTHAQPSNPASNGNDSDTASVKSDVSSSSSKGSMEVSANPVSSGNPNGGGSGLHTKLKKAWLTRHSKEDRMVSSDKVNPSAGPTEKLPASESPSLQPIQVASIKEVDEDQRPEMVKERRTKRAAKRALESEGSESDDSEGPESRAERRAKRLPKPTYKKKENDMQKKKPEKQEDEKKNGVFNSGKLEEKPKLKLDDEELPESVLKDWRKVKRLKQTGEAFLQDGACTEITPSLQKCRECRMVRYRKGQEVHSAVFCRFYHFRRLSFNKNGALRIYGFSAPNDCTADDLSLWVPGGTGAPALRAEGGIESARYILSHVGPQFCRMVQAEKDAKARIPQDAKVAWKRAVRGVREMCDACEATLFNVHWVCPKCGFVVCPECYTSRREKRDPENEGRKETFSWIKCVKGQVHDPKNLIPTQIIPGTALYDLGELMHATHERLGMASNCPCFGDVQSKPFHKLLNTNGVSQVLHDLIASTLKNGINIVEPKQEVSVNSPAKDTKGEVQDLKEFPNNNGNDNKCTESESQTALHWLADLATQKAKEEKKVVGSTSVPPVISSASGASSSSLRGSGGSGGTLEHGSSSSTLRDLLTTTAGKLRIISTDGGMAFAPVMPLMSHTDRSSRSMPNLLDDIIASVVENKIPPNVTSGESSRSQVKCEQLEEALGHAPMKVDGVATWKVPHGWLCGGCILHLYNPTEPNNWRAFRECWTWGQPVVVSRVHEYLRQELWNPESLARDICKQETHLVDCNTLAAPSNTILKDFWEGFQDNSVRPKNESGEPMVLKLKEWPTGDDFRDLLPDRFEDLTRNVPLAEYTTREGRLNLASHPPDFFVRPELGPKLHVAYGLLKEGDIAFGTRGIHSDLADTINILVHVEEAAGTTNSREVLQKALEVGEADETMKLRFSEAGQKAGALWHIFSAGDASKVREFLSKVAAEKEEEEEPVEGDVAPTPSIYLDAELRRRLQQEQGVRPVALVQCLGDALLIPAGSLYQVQNLYNCIAVSDDFVSPENVQHCLRLTHELRQWPDGSHEDKLQVKNIIYHVVKNMVGILSARELKNDSQPTA